MRILMVANTLKTDTSGTSVRALRFEKEFKRMKHKVFMIKPVTNRFHPFIRFIINLIYSRRHLNKRCQVVYSVSDLLPDAIFGVWYKKRHPKAKFICGCHSIATPTLRGKTPLHPIYSFISQRLILRYLRGYVDKMLVSNLPDKIYLNSKGFKNVRIVYAAPNF